MGHHLDSDGRFQSDKHDWLPPDTVLVSTEHPQARPVLELWLDRLLDLGGHVGTPSLEHQPGAPYPKLLLNFQDPRDWILLDELATCYGAADPEFAGDVRTRLVRVRADSDVPGTPEYARKHFGGGECPACGARLNKAGSRHADGSSCRP